MKFKTEREFQRELVRMAKALGWYVHFVRDSRNSTSDIGYPDLTLAKAGTVIFAELKMDPRRYSRTASQTAWHDAIGNVRLWTPKDWNEIERTLTRG